MKKRIIDLLNDLLNSRNVPKTISEGGLEWAYSEEKKDYLLQHSEDSKEIYFFQDKVASDLTFGIEFLTKEIEIIEENIEKFDIESENGRYRLKFNSCSYSLNDINYIILSKINEVIDAVNKLMENKK